jgi:predicted TIM-barrel fold metal-dependent hydrolase
VNDLFAKEFRTDALRPVGLLPIRTASDAVRELQRSVNELGITAFTLPTNGLPFALGDPYYDIVYEQAERLGARLCVHGSRNWAREFGGDKLRTFAEVHSYAFTAGILLQFTSIMCQGVTERFPELRLAFLEIGATWLPYYLDRLDEHWVKRRSEMPHLSRSPSAAFRDSHVKISIEADETLLAQTIDYGGAEHFFFATDIPHWDSEFPGNLAALRATNSLDPVVKKKLLYSNAKEFSAL